MELNILQLYLDGLTNFFNFIELSTFLHESTSILSLLKPLFKCYILHLLICIKTHIMT
jgi:hypothetical protein